MTAWLWVFFGFLIARRFLPLTLCLIAWPIFAAILFTVDQPLLGRGALVMFSILVVLTILDPFIKAFEERYRTQVNRFFELLRLGFEPIVRAVKIAFGGGLAAFALVLIYRRDPQGFFPGLLEIIGGLTFLGLFLAFVWLYMKGLLWLDQQIARKLPDNFFSLIMRLLLFFVMFAGGCASGLFTPIVLALRLS